MSDLLFDRIEKLSRSGYVDRNDVRKLIYHLEQDGTMNAEASKELLQRVVRLKGSFESGAYEMLTTFLSRMKRG